MWFLDSTKSSWMFLLGVALMVAILMRMYFRNFKRLRKEKSAEKSKKYSGRRKMSSPSSSKTPLIDAPPEVLRWQVDMHDISREMKAELDSKMSALQALMRKASEETARLETAIAKAESLGIPSKGDALEQIERLAASANPLSGEDPPRDEGLVSKEEVMAILEKRRTKVYELSDQGQRPSEIAEAIGAAVGEIEMILSLRSFQ